ncbi:MAG: 7-carboxy-7-deazaguanine synthase QueE [Ferruginibacter sp.]
MLTTSLSNIAKLPVMEHFYTLQGEGFHQGRAAYFIRLGGCDVGCVWCDVKESWDANAHPLINIADLVGEVKKMTAKLVVITGGEPLMHNLDVLTQKLKEAGCETNIETSGSAPLSGVWDWICLSPKKFKAPLPQLIEKANELKIIVYNKSDFEWAELYAAQVSPGCRLYLQPEWGKSAEMLPLITGYIKQNPQWELSVQLHKFINVP